MRYKLRKGFYCKKTVFKNTGTVQYHQVLEEDTEAPPGFSIQLLISHRRKMVFSSRVPGHLRFYEAGGGGGGWCAPSSLTSMGFLQLTVSLFPVATRKLRTK